MQVQKEDIKKFIIENVGKHPTDLVRFSAVQLGVSRQAVSQHVNSLIKENILEGEGAGKNRKFQLKETLQKFYIDITLDTHEDVIWRTNVKPVLPQISKEIENICFYGFTEMLNNIIDHSGSEKAVILIKHTALYLEIQLIDIGIGIFKKIQQTFGLGNVHHALLELAKGKLTTDPKRHSGEGIFFTSRVFDEFWIASDGLLFSHDDLKDILIDIYTPSIGTAVSMKIAKKSDKTLVGVFDFYANNPGELTFDKTVVPIRMALYEGEQLVSRSQAKRIMNRLENFKEIILDFKDVSFVGRAFIDEIFRVYKNEHPELIIDFSNATDEIQALIKMALKNG